MTTAIIDLIKQMDPIIVDDTPHLRLDDVVDAVVAHRHPDGLQTEAAWNEAVRQTLNGLADAGYIPAGELTPPTAPFARRGAYYKAAPAISAEMVEASLDFIKSKSWDSPHYRVTVDKLYYAISMKVYETPYIDLARPLRRRLAEDVTAHAEALGWTATESNTILLKPLAIDEEAVKAKLDQIFATGDPVYGQQLIGLLTRAAYDRTYYDNIPQELNEMVQTAAEKHGYEQTNSDTFTPKMPAIPDDAEQQLIEQLQGLPVYEQLDGKPIGLLYSDVVVAADNIVNGGMTSWHINRCAHKGFLGRALRRLGYKAISDTAPRKIVRGLHADDSSPRFFKKEQHFTTAAKPETLRLAEGMTVHAPTVVLDEDEETVIALHLVGPEESVKANWAALMGGNKYHYIKRARVKLGGSKGHVTLRQTLPCGWQELWLIHKQASAAEMTPDAPFYVLDDGERVPPPTFFPTLDRALTTPLQEAWATDLWLRGREERLIAPATDSDSTGYGAWRVLPAVEGWTEIVSDGLASGRLAF